MEFIRNIFKKIGISIVKKKSLDILHRDLKILDKKVKISSNKLKNDKTFILPDLLQDRYMVDPSYEIVNIAFRVHDPDRGLTGGPNGVLFTQKQIMGNNFKGIPLKYYFEPKNYKVPDYLNKSIKHLSTMVRGLFRGAYFISQTIPELRVQAGSKKYLFVCHEVDSAYGCYLAKQPYVLIYHQQGSLVHERRSFGAELSEDDIYFYNNIEKVVFENALEVYFPSRGAKESFTSTTELTDVSKVNFSDSPLYNSIPEEKVEISEDDPFLKELGISLDSIKDKVVFLSVGDFSENKGIDRVPKFIEQYSKNSEKSVLWIAIGAKHKRGIYDQLKLDSASYNFESIIIGERTNHSNLLKLMKLANIYIMFQRHSIFDFSTLEAMREGCCLVLSPVGGNLEVNRCDNVIYSDDYESAVKKLLKCDINELGKLSKKCFDEFFSYDSFFKQYANMYTRQLNKLGLDNKKRVDETNSEISNYKNKLSNNKIVICGAGKSLDRISIKPNTKYIALNSALFCDKVKFDYLFIQDSPKDRDITEYLGYDCEKFVGVINLPAHKKMGFSDYNFESKVIRYQLDPMLYNYRLDRFTFDLDCYSMSDAQSVLFSALQFAVFSGCKDIELIGVDFSSDNYGDKPNPNKYSVNVVNNLITFKNQLKELDKNITLTIKHSENHELMNMFNSI